MTADGPIALKGGHVTGDRRLDRIPQYDPRNDQYPAARLLAATLATPRSYSWPVPIHLDQGVEGACVGFAVSHELAGVPDSRPGQTNKTARELYWQAQRADPWPGGSYPGASPVYEGTSVLAGVEIARKQGLYRSYHWARTADEVAVAVSRRGPVVIGVQWYDGMMWPDRNGFLNRTGSVVGGHATLLHGYNVTGRYFWVWNSWGTDWGINGRAKLRHDDLDELLADNGDAVIPVRVGG